MSNSGRRPPPIGPRLLINHHHHDSGSGSGSGEKSKRDGAARDDGHRNTDRNNRNTSSSSYPSSSKDREPGYRPRHYPDAPGPSNSSHDHSRSTTHDTRSSAPNPSTLLRHNQCEFLRASSQFFPQIFLTLFSASLSRHQHQRHTANATRTITNPRMATARGGT
jgi:hypothetical protein